MPRNQHIGLLVAMTLLISSRLCFGAALSRAPIDPALLQIAIEVVEVDETKTSKLGVEWVNHVAFSELAVPAVLQVGTLVRTALYADLQAMISDGAADLLANPKLVTRDGTEANFHAGGELPYITSASLGTTSVLFKQYGVNLKIKPHLLGESKMNIAVEAEVSSPDVQRSVSLSGNIVPGLLSRRVQSDLTMTVGTTLTLAGLIQNQKQWQRQGVPGLSKIPLLGYLFSRRIEETRRTSIVIFITPTLLEGAPPAPSSSIPSSLPKPRNQPPVHPGTSRPVLGELQKMGALDNGTPLDELLGIQPLPEGASDVPLF